MNVRKVHAVGLCAAVIASAAAAVSTAQAQPTVASQWFAPRLTGDDAPPPLVWNAAAGAVLNTGNTENLTVNGGSHFAMLRDKHGVGADAKVVWGASQLDDDRAFEKTAFNINLFGRYDYYLTDNDALFVAAAYRHDEFAGLSHRLQGKTGYMRNFFKDESQRFWGEVGYDLTWDVLFQSANPDLTENSYDTVHAVRGFVGYDNHITESLAFLTGVEILLNVENAEDTRVNWDNTLTSQLVDQLSLELKFLLQFDNVPVLDDNGNPRKEVDTITQLNLIYTFI